MSELSSSSTNKRKCFDSTSSEKTFTIIGHRGFGANTIGDNNVMENTIASFNAASEYVKYVEFDVQVLKDGCPIIFHDLEIITDIFSPPQGLVPLKVVDLDKSGFKNCHNHVYKVDDNGKYHQWKGNGDGSTLCTLEEVFDKVNKSLNFLIELKFDAASSHDTLKNNLEQILKVVNSCKEERKCIFASFHPFAASFLKELVKDDFQVYFLTEGKSTNSLEEAFNFCKSNKLDGVICEAKAILKNLDTADLIVKSEFALYSYGQMNNMPEALWLQHILGLDGVVVDRVKEIPQNAIPTQVSEKEISLVLLGLKIGSEMMAP